MDSAQLLYRNKRSTHWDSVSSQKEKSDRIGAYYQKLLQAYYRFLIPSGMRVLELGSGIGELLNAVEPSYGVGVDFSGEMIKKASAKYPHLNFIQADAQEFLAARPRRGDAAGLVDDRQAGDVESAQAVQPLGRERGGGDVGELAGQVAQLALRVDEAGLLGALGAVADQFHGLFLVSWRCRRRCTGRCRW